MKLTLTMKRWWRGEEDADLSKAERSLRYPGQEWVRGRLLGEGSFGCVNIAYFPNPKTPEFQGMPSVTAVKSALMSRGQELKLEKQILHHFEDSPFIVRCLGDNVTYDDNDELVLNVFLEFASGGTLFDMVTTTNDRLGLRETQAKRFTKSILGGLRQIHEEGFVHCDIKLENVLLFKQENGDFVAKVADFGSAQSIEQIKVGRVCGTKLYWAPEMLTGGRVQGQPSDIWALGCVVFTMLTGRLLWDKFGKQLTKQKLMDLIATESVVLPRGLFSDSAEDFLYQCFRRDPQKRPTAAMLLMHPFVSRAFKRRGRK